MELCGDLNGLAKVKGVPCSSSLWHLKQYSIENVSNHPTFPKVCRSIPWPQKPQRASEDSGPPYMT
jgi:hypothetical protein